MIHSRVYKPTALPGESCSLFLDIQEVTLLLGKYTLFSSANLYYPTTRLSSYFSTIFVAHLRVYTHTMGCKRSFNIRCNSSFYLMSKKLTLRDPTEQLISV